MAFDTGVTASSIVEAALVEYLERHADDKSPVGAKPRPSSASPATNHVKVEGQTYVSATIAPDAAMSTTPVEPDPKSLSAKVSGPLPWTRVDTPEEAAKVAAFVPSFNPVPKPGTTKKASR